MSEPIKAMHVVPDYPRYGMFVDIPEFRGFMSMQEDESGRSWLMLRALTKPIDETGSMLRQRGTPDKPCLFRAP